MRLFQNRGGQRRAQKLQETTFTNFGGGLNTLDEDLGMSLRYQVELQNFRRLPNGAQTVRWGNRRFADVAGVVNGNIVDSFYFGTRLIHVTDAGEIATVSDNGSASVIWNAAIAALLPGSPDGWSPLTAVDFVPFRDTVVIHNGVDKPVRVKNTYLVEYDQDDATGSNVNYPIGKYGCTVGNYHVVAGIPASPTEVYISSKGTSGVFIGDTDSDAISIDVGAYAPEGGDEIVGVAGFRSQLLVFFPRHTLVVTLGIYNDAGVHTPEFPDSLPSFGLLSHRCIMPILGDIMFADVDGLNSAKRNLFSGLVEPAQLSAEVSPTYRKVMGSLPVADQRTKTFAVYDQLHGDAIVFAPGGKAFCYSFSQRLRYASWSTYTHRDIVSACVSTKGRVFYTKGTKVYQMGNLEYQEAYYGDEVDDYDVVWSTDTSLSIGARVLTTDGVFEVVVAHTTGPTTFEDDYANNPQWWTPYLGYKIPIVFEMPWFSGEQPATVKNLRFLSIAARGSAHFTAALYVDDLYKNAYGEVIHDPELVMEVVGNDYRGAGFNVNSGGARKTGGPKLYKFPAKFKKCKPRFYGEVNEPLTIVAITFLFARGKFKR